MNEDVFLFFNKTPRALPLYEAVAGRILSELDGVRIKVQKTQISFANKHQFAFVSLPFRKVKGRPDVYIILTFGLSHRVLHPRIVESTEPYPNRWTHHVIIQDEEEIDDQIMGWIREAYDFSLVK